jgi:hypothetical protein
MDKQIYINSLKRLNHHSEFYYNKFLDLYKKGKSMSEHDAKIMCESWKKAMLYAKLIRKLKVYIYKQERVGSEIYGKHAHTIIMDDPVNGIK